jgi:hypothetical protein
MLLSAPEISPKRASELSPYLALPADLPPRIARLAQEITRSANGPFDKARLIERHLQTQYRYTLDLKRDERYEPLEDFLFIQRAGHCEYFASAMAVMLRTQGVPSRSVNGFLGGEWNPYGNYLAVRQGDAHAWVEVFIEGAGWVTFDPTPVAPPQSGTSAWLQKARLLLDTVQLTWFKYVIEYDFGKQVDAVSSARKWAQHFGYGETGSRGKRGWLHIGMRALVVIGVGLLLGWMWRRRSLRVVGARTSRRAQRAHTAFARAERALERRGIARMGSGETPRELAARARLANDPAAQAFAQLVELYYAARFGSAPISEPELARLARSVIRPRPAPQARV